MQKIVKVALVDSKERDIRHLSNLIMEWNKKEKYMLKIQTFNCAELLFTDKIDFDVIFLDIKLPGIDGISAAKKLRSCNYNNHIIFVTDFSEYVFWGYDVQALNYLLKPITFNQIKKNMDIVLSYNEIQCYKFKSKSTVIKIPYNNIVFFSSAKHYIEINTHEDIFAHIATMKQLNEILPNYFMQSHRTLIVNTRKIQKLQCKEIELANGIKLPVSNTYIKDIREAMLSG